MRKSVFALSMCMLLGMCATATAAGYLKAGLWEMTMKSDQIAKNMPKMTPEQMEMMRKRGINMPQMQDGAMVTKVCISKEMAEREHPPMEHKDSGCQSKNVQRNGNTSTVDIVCDGPNMKGNGTAKWTKSGDNTYNSTYDFKGTMHGRPVDQHVESSGKWLTADCGDVKSSDQMLREMRERRGISEKK